MCKNLRNVNIKNAVFVNVKCDLKLAYWNIHGVKAKEIQNKLQDTEFLNKITGIDIVGLSELHTIDDVSLPGFKLVKQKNRKKNHKGPKICGGVAVFVKENYEYLVQVIPNDNEDSIWINIKSPNFKVHDDIYIGTFYMSPKKIKNDVDLFTTLNEEINQFKKKGTVFIQGDLNARTASKLDFITYDKFDEILGVENHANYLNRNSEDTTFNQRGVESYWTFVKQMIF